MNHFFEGIRILRTERRLWPYVWKPMAWAALIYIAVYWSVISWATPHVTNLIQQLGVEIPFVQVIARVLLMIAWALIGGAVYMSIVGLLSSLLWESLTREIERMHGAPNRKPPSLWQQLVDTVIRVPFSAAIVVTSFVLGLFGLGLVSMLLLGWLGLYDYSACAYVRRGILFNRQFAVALRAPGASGFGLMAGIVTLVPLANIVLLPSLVVGGTLLSLEQERLNQHDPVRMG